MVLAMKSGLDPALAYKVLTDGAGNSRMFQVRGPMMVKGDYASDVTMKLSVWQKDMNAIADFAKANGCPTPLFSATAPLYIAATANIRGRHRRGLCRHREDSQIIAAANDAAEPTFVDSA
jgi:3-hydroxyisobutyrate dehydrogenase-like beta-hydroxyacid dehydrogenase